MEELKFYTYPSCTSCRRTKSWLNSQGVVFNEQHLFRETPTADELKQILALTTNGIDEILAKRSKEFKALDINVEDLSLNEFLNLVIEKPKLLRRPILTNGDKLVVGYDPDGLRGITDKRMEYTEKIS
ncbi:Spx/MgsR family RNA polymerase-binding regulatory protein [Halobacillus litoralis]|uniref:Spx/MgsR family RNA polymerase-binding regulatory protein n=1 Tax=Halobacillus litoralis TaxID=45668 RepID=A0A845E248_9BACI|nr:MULTISPECIES: Spx/MgsR family RNA polymerase-binding regulatory protein [Halobacillus]MYL19764.1 Spx/MgsR family RNA polymerase-binding regulatory protein [Halobacillus litoralis]MYL28910.1 Spx/MgsR family RNA polymerase-binding regulatory protein [Halobacillus halophilus]MYL37161.1 Spx/MgsR family RNA polymerase-binding regulatory protein [Halobacillus litoralis]